MARNREKNREKVKASKKEERLSSKNEFGVSDLTPMMAVDRIIKGGNYGQDYKSL